MKSDQRTIITVSPDYWSFYRKITYHFHHLSFQGVFTKISNKYDAIKKLERAYSFLRKLPYTYIARRRNTVDQENSSRLLCLSSS